MTSNIDSALQISLSDDGETLSSRDSSMIAASPETMTDDLDNNPSEYARQAVQFLTDDLNDNIARFTRKLLCAVSYNEDFALSDEVASRLISRELELSVEASKNIWKAARQKVEAVLTVDDETRGSITFSVNDQCGSVDIAAQDPAVAALALACTFGRWQQWYHEQEETPPGDGNTSDGTRSYLSGEISLKKGDHVYQQFFGPGWSQSFTSIVNDRA